VLAESNGQDDLLSAIQAELIDLKKQGAPAGARSSGGRVTRPPARPVVWPS
jgi:hypothetical protein